MAFASCANGHQRVDVKCITRLEDLLFVLGLIASDPSLFSILSIGMIIYTIIDKGRYYRAYFCDGTERILNFIFKHLPMLILQEIKTRNSQVVHVNFWETA